MNTPTELKESDLLAPFEIEHLPRDYKEYYLIKRNNFFASIQGFPEMWKYYTMLDAIWPQEISDLKPYLAAGSASGQQEHHKRRSGIAVEYGYGTSLSDRTLSPHDE